MGLPLFVEPVEPEKAVKNAEQTAARSRSSIRRQRSARRPNYPLYPEANLLRLPLSGPSSPMPPNQFLGYSDIGSSEEADIEAIRERVAAGRRLRDAVRDFPHTSMSRSDFERMTRGGRDRLSSNPHRRVDTPSIPHAGSSSTTRPMPPVPESRDFESRRRPVLSSRRSGSWTDYGRDSAAYQMEPYPPIFPRDTTTDPAANGSGTRLPALTPNFSPARGHMLEEPRDHPRNNNLPSFVHQLYPTDVRSPQRISRRAITDVEARRLRLRAARLDGLGDRDRSLSPDGDGAWETMLTTLTPDPQLPSAGSSFASASAANSASSASDSQGTSLTTMSSNHNANENSNAAMETVCDILEDEDSSSAVSDTEDEEDLYELHDDHDVRDRFWRSYADVVASRADRVARHHGAADADNLGGMQRIVRRLARREDIPDEWWAEVGLSRTFPRETNIVQANLG